MAQSRRLWTVPVDGRKSPKVCARPFRGSRCGCGGSESREKRALILPLGWQGAPLAPVGREAEGLFACQDISHEIRCEEGKIDHVLDAAFGDAVGSGNIAKGFARLDP